MRYLVLLFSLALLCWGITLPEAPLGNAFMFWRRQGIQATGILSITLMGALMLMATRPRWLEQRLGGLDRLYKLHKWSGISAGICVLLHWGLTQSPKWLSSMGLLTSAQRGGHHGAGLWRLLAREAGEWCFYILGVFILISLVQAFPYRPFRKIHRIGAVLFLMAAFHSIYFIPGSLRWMPFGLLTVIASTLGCIAALISLLGIIGKSRRFKGQVSAIRQLPGTILEVDVQLPQALPGYKAGQFAFLTFDSGEGAHPFTIVCSDQERKRLTFAIKALGDYTRKLSSAIKVGDSLAVEGPYGNFVLPETVEREYWIAGGIGITPFIAWLEALAIKGEQRPDTRLYYCVNSPGESVFAERLQSLCAATAVKLTVLNQQQHGSLKPADLPVDHKTPVWFCGPRGMRDMLKKYLRNSQLHYEHFEFR